MLESDFNGYKVRLVESIEDLKFMVSQINPKIKIGIDTETNGLTYQKDSVAGICISCGKTLSTKDYVGYYIPLRHIDYENNLPIKLVMSIVQDLIDKTVTVFWNRNFDLSMMEYDGLKIPFVGHMQDGQIMAHLAFSESYPALKETTQKLLKWNILEFSSNKAKDHNFMTTDPRVSYIYAAGDPLQTVMTTIKLWNDYPYIRKIYPLDNKALEAVRLLSASNTYLDFKFLKSMLDTERAKLREYREECIQLAGYPFNVNSSQEKAQALERFVTLTKKTPSGKFKVDDETLSTIDHPLAKALIKYSAQRTYLSSFLEKLCSFDDGKPIHVNYSSVNVACITENNLVSIFNGEVKPNRIRIGDLVHTRFGLRQVTATTSFIDSCIHVVCSNNYFIEGNLKHPVLVNNRWVELQDLELGDSITTFDSVSGITSTAEVLDIYSVGKKVVYGFEVEGVHEFIANGLVTHNTGRLSSGGSVGNLFFRSLNGQNIPKVEVKGYIHKDPELGYIVNEDPHNCVSEQSRVTTPQGEIPIKDLNLGDLVLSSKGFRKVTNKWNSVKPKVTITLTTGEKLVCSPEHKIRVIRNSKETWVQAGKLLSTDYIVIKNMF